MGDPDAGSAHPRTPEAPAAFEWAGCLDRETYSDWFVQGRDALADAARDGHWERALTLLLSENQLSPNHWRAGGTSWFTPLHQAAFRGAPFRWRC